MSKAGSQKLAAAALAALASCVVAACGGSSSPSSSASQQATNEAKAVKFAQCLREHGLAAETAKAPGGAGPALKLSGGGGGTPINKQSVEAAMTACKRYRPTEQGPKLTPAERAARVDQTYKFARCMREHGINVKTETSGGGNSVGIQLQGGTGPGNPGFEAAQKACEKYMPFKGAKRTGGGPPGPGGQALDAVPAG
ncbi:MAG TPA: hypothetical protein VGN08_14230 [Solirubrobacteraceae bacterium]|jgi:hypothetical protein